MQHNYIVVVITYNPTINIIKKYDSLHQRYLIVDNSELLHPEVESAMKENTDCYYIKNHTNLGIATALNIACDYALKNNFKYIITMDQDSDLTIDIISSLLAFLEKFPDKNKLAILTPRHIFYNDVLNNKFNTSDYKETVLTMTSGNLLDLEVWKKVGGFKESLFIDTVDTEYYIRARKYGYKVIQLNNIFMTHQLGNMFKKKIFGKVFDVMNHNYLRKYYQIRNGLFLLEDNLLFPHERKLIRNVLIINNILFTILFEKNKFKKLVFLFLGYLDYLREISGKCRWCK